MGQFSFSKSRNCINTNVVHNNFFGKSMRLVLMIFLTTLTTSCNYERVFIGDVDKLTANQMENNQIEIDRIKREIKEFKIENREGNISLMDKLDQLHESVRVLNDSIDLVDKNTALSRTIDFINKNFNNLESFNEVPLQVDEDTPRPLL